MKLRALAVAVTLTLAPLLAVTVSTAPAQAGSGIYTYNRPSTVEAGGAEYIAWDDKTTGAVHVAKLNFDDSINVTWTDPNSTTYPGTGPTIAAANHTIVVAWTDSTGVMNLAEPVGGGGGSLGCETPIDAVMWSEVPNGPNSVYSVDTPYLTSEGDDGSGNLYMTWADDQGTYMHVTTLGVPSASQCANTSFTLLNNHNIYTDTTWDGPAMVVSGYGTGTEDYWLMWAGNDTAHHINIAEYSFAWNRISKSTESNHATLTDMGAAYDSATKAIWMSYCGTNHGVYYQHFTSTSGGTENSIPGAACDINTYTPGSITYYSGGVGVGYEYSDQLMFLSWADRYSYQITFARAK